jgi:uncharacterized protein DUF4242
MRESAELRPAFLVERYMPGVTRDEVTALAARLESCVRQIRRSGTRISWVGSAALLGEETTFCLFQAPSREVVRALNELASAPFERIIEAFYVEGQME